MARPLSLAITAAVLDTNGLALSQTPAAGGAQALTLTAGTTLDIARHVTVTSTLDETARTFTFVGTDRFGNAITEVVAGLNGATASSLLNFKTVTSITVDDDTTGAVEAGWGNTFETQWIPLDRAREEFDVSLAVHTLGGSSLAFKAQTTYDDVQVKGFQENDAVAFDHATMTGKTAADDDVITTPCRAVRFHFSAFTTAASATAAVTQSGL